MMHQSVIRTLCLAALVTVAGCRGMRSEDPPIHPNLNMDYQEKFQPQEANPFFRGLTPPCGCLYRAPWQEASLAEDPVFYLGRTPSGEYVEEMPVPAHARTDPPGARAVRPSSARSATASQEMGRASS